MNEKTINTRVKYITEVKGHIENATQFIQGNIPVFSVDAVSNDYFFSNDDHFSYGYESRNIPVGC